MTFEDKLNAFTVQRTGSEAGTDFGGYLPPKTYESDSIHHNFVQFENHH